MTAGLKPSVAARRPGQLQAPVEGTGHARGNEKVPGIGRPQPDRGERLCPQAVPVVPDARDKRVFGRTAEHRLRGVGMHLTLSVV